MLTTFNGDILNDLLLRLHLLVEVGRSQVQLLTQHRLEVGHHYQLS